MKFTKQEAYATLKLKGDFYETARYLGITPSELSGIFHEKKTSIQLPKNDVCDCQHWDVCKVSGRLCEDRHCQVEN